MKTKYINLLVILAMPVVLVAGSFSFNTSNVPAGSQEHARSNIVPVQPDKDGVFTIVATDACTLEFYILGRSPSENRLYPVKLTGGTNTVVIPASEFIGCPLVAIADCTPNSLVSVVGTWR